MSIGIKWRWDGLGMELEMSWNGVGKKLDLTWIKHIHNAKLTRTKKIINNAKLTRFTKKSS